MILRIGIHLNPQKTQWVMNWWFEFGTSCHKILKPEAFYGRNGQLSLAMPDFESHVRFARSCTAVVVFPLANGGTRSDAFCESVIIFFVLAILAHSQSPFAMCMCALPFMGVWRRGGTRSRCIRDFPLSFFSRNECDDLDCHSGGVSTIQKIKNTHRFLSVKWHCTTLYSICFRLY